MTRKPTALRFLALAATIGYLMFATGTTRPAVEFLADIQLFEEGHKCAGNGCACDNAGYELPGCSCVIPYDSDSHEPTDSCCEPPQEIVKSSCCGSDNKLSPEPAYVMKGGCGGGEPAKEILSKNSKEILFTKGQQTLMSFDRSGSTPPEKVLYYLSQILSPPDKVPRLS